MNQPITAAAAYPFAERKRVRLNEVQINLAPSDRKTPPFHLRRVSLPSGYACKTSHTCLLVSGEFQGSVVFPSGACFSRLEDDDYVRLYAARQIKFEGNRFILCPKACFSISDWPL